MNRLCLLIGISVFAAGSTGCSRQEPQAPSTPAQPITPLLNSPSPGDQSPQDAMSVETRAGGTPTNYQAYFAAGQLARISEKRMVRADETALGDYEFQGARLLKYSGASLNGATHLEFVFDLQGAVLTARSDGEDASAEQISAIRDRAQLLRSHALAQRATRGHATM